MGLTAHNLRRNICVGLACLLLFFPLSLPIRSAPANSPPLRIALTFDDGPSRQYTAKILDILQKYNVKATFFVVGVNVEKQPALLRRVIAEGHEVGNHTYSHPHLHKMDKATLTEELAKTDQLLREVGGISPTLFRPPEGVVNPAVKTAAQSGGYSLVLWTIDTRDWALNSSNNIIRMIDQKATDGDIILFHDWIAGDSPTPAVLEIIIPRLQKRGFEFVTVSELRK